MALYKQKVGSFCHTGRIEMKRRAVYLLLFLLLILTLLLWLFIKAFATLNSTGSLLRIPKQMETYDGINSNITQGIQIHLPTGAKLVSPIQNNDEIIRRADFNHDGNDDIIYFYKNYRKKNELSLSVIFYKDNLWLKALQIDKKFLDVDLIRFIDITGDGKDELLIGWKAKNSQMARLDIYTWEDNQLKKILSTPYTKMFIDNKKTEKFFGNRDKLILWKANGPYYEADVIAWNNRNFVSVSEYYPEDFKTLIQFYNNLNTPEKNQNQYWYYRAITNMAAKKYKDAKECIDKAMSYKTDQETMLAYRVINGSCITLTRGYKVDEKLIRVIDDIGKIKDIRTKNSLLFDAYYYLGGYFFRIKDYKNALFYFDLSMKCCKAFCGDNKELYQMKIYKMKGDRAEAIACTNK